jgi:hypothetical protein
LLSSAIGGTRSLMVCLSAIMSTKRGSNWEITGMGTGSFCGAVGLAP